MCMVTNLAMSVVNNQPTAGYICSMMSASFQHISSSQQAGTTHLSPFQVSNLLKAVSVLPVVINRGLFKWPFIRETNHPRSKY